jgi:hypothetical protein
MKSDHRHKGLILFIVISFILPSFCVAFAGTTTYIYDDVNHKVTVTRGTQGASPTYSISGIITDSSSNPLSGVTISLTGSATSSTTTDSNGFYGFSGLSNGSYTITPTKTGYTFSPVNRTVSISGGDVMSQNFTGSASATTLSVTPNTVAKGSSVTVTFNNATTPTSTDWIGLYTPGSADTAYLSWIYDSSCTQTAGTARASGSCQYLIPADLPVGTYEFRLFANDGYTRLAVSNALTVVIGVSTLSVAPNSIARGSSVTVAFNNANVPTSTDWIGLYTPGAADTAYLSWIYDSSCTQTAGTARASGSCQYLIPADLPVGEETGTGCFLSKEAE